MLFRQLLSGLRSPGKPSLPFIFGAFVGFYCITMVRQNRHRTTIASSSTLRLIEGGGSMQEKNSTHSHGISHGADDYIVGQDSTFNDSHIHNGKSIENDKVIKSKVHSTQIGWIHISFIYKSTCEKCRKGFAYLNHQNANQVYSIHPFHPPDR